ncbi:amidohydrolase family protein [Streptomyces sp. NPDC056910]|uniref:amidohydrolase family protein n=1 Tax=Streptomyces sp. NPDC056910 TaxID=3345964 RepID=UPI003681FA50
MHTHSSETIWEVEESLRQFGRCPIEELYNRGIPGPCTVVAHCVWLDDREIELLARSGTSVAHCPCSNMKLSSGPARVITRRKGITVGLGSDCEKENNNLDLLEEMKFASLLQMVSTLDPTTGDPWDILTMATLEGARALGLDVVTGSLEVGKQADIVTCCEDLAPAFPRDQPGKDGQPDPIGGLIAAPGDLAAQHRVLVPQRQHLRVFRPAAAQHGSRLLDQIPDQRGDDRQ